MSNVISMDKQYRTRDGREVRIYAVDGNGLFPVHGAVLGDNGWQAHVWGANGCYSSWGQTTIDLIEVKPKRIYEQWVNVYPSGTGANHHTKEEADLRADTLRLACLHIRLEYEEGEGL